jgi:T5SS/PEP-CTERM-associated repeat protein/autotransporter-associated beta strand protein
MWWEPQIIPTPFSEVIVGIDGISNPGPNATGGVTISAADAFCYRATIGYGSGNIGTISVTNDKNLSVGDIINVGLSGKGTLNIGGSSLVSNGGNAYVGRYVTGNGTVNSYGTWTTNGHNLYIGHEGDGTLNVYGNSVSNSDGYLGFKTGGKGSAIISGSGSRWINDGNLYVGPGGEGMLAIQGGGKVTNFHAFVGSAPDSLGKVAVNGAGTEWNSRNNLWVGLEGAGTLEISAGAKVTNIWTFVGENALGTGTVVVSGSGSEWNNSGYANSPIALNVGRSGTGSVTVEKGGLVYSYHGSLGGYTTGNGIMNVTGSGSRWNSLAVQVGDYGTGTLHVQDAGTVTSTAGYIGTYAGGTGIATVSGPESQWINSGELRVGDRGEGTLAIGNSGKVSNTFGRIGVSTGSTGTVNVDGAGSEWLCEGSGGNGLSVGESGDGNLSATNGGSVIVGGRLNVGSYATGKLSISSGASVHTNYAYLGRIGGSPGTVDVSGPSSRFTTTSWTEGNTNGGLSLYINNGRMNILDGGKSESFAPSIGTFSGGNGTVSISGNNSEWTVTGQMQIGDDGNGRLEILAGGKVIVKGNGYLGTYSSGSGSAVVSGVESQWINDEELRVGYRGNGTLHIESGGNVRSRNGIIGRLSGSSGQVTVSDNGSKWENSRYLNVGGFGDGGLLIQEGGNVVARVGVWIASYSVPAVSGSVQVSGSAENRGRLETAYIYGDETGNASMIFDGGQISATDTLAVEGFVDGAIQIEKGGLWVDVGDFDGDFYSMMTGVGGLTKLGASTLFLYGDNTYSGPTLITGGTLTIFGDHSEATGIVEVSHGATLSGAESLGGDVTIHRYGTHHVEVIPYFEIHFPNQVKGKVVYEAGSRLSISAFMQPEPGIYELVWAEGGLSLDPDAAIELDGISGAFVSVVGGDKLILTVAEDDGPENYAEWASLMKLDGSGLAAANEDADADGYDNGTEYVLGGNPLDGSDNPRIYPTLVERDGSGEKGLILTIAVPRGMASFPVGSPSSSADFQEFSITVRGSSDLRTFTVTVYPVAPPADLPEPSQNGGMAYVYRSFRLEPSDASESHGFLQVVVTRRP